VSVPEMGARERTVAGTLAASCPCKARQPADSRTVERFRLGSLTGKPLCQGGLSSEVTASCRVLVAGSYFPTYAIYMPCLSYTKTWRSSSYDSSLFSSCSPIKVRGKYSTEFSHLRKADSCLAIQKIRSFIAAVTGIRHWSLY
jgi:hypothetical protein